MASFAVVKRDQNMPLLRAGGHSRLPSPVTSFALVRGRDARHRDWLAFV